MVLNLGILNRVLFRPTLFDQYRTGPGDELLTMMAIISIGMAKTALETPASNISTIRFIVSD
jgi:hypothetical protein